MDSTLVAHRNYPAKIHADLAVSALRASGIDAFVRGGGVNCCTPVIEQGKRLEYRESGGQSAVLPGHHRADQRTVRRAGMKYLRSAAAGLGAMLFVYGAFVIAVLLFAGYKGFFGGVGAVLLSAYLVFVMEFPLALLVGIAVFVVGFGWQLIRENRVSTDT